MRVIHLLTLLIAAVLGFGAVVTRAENAPLYVPILFAGAAVVIVAFVGKLDARTRRIVLVGPRSEAPVGRLREALDDGGFRIVSCRGPMNRPCPALEGKACPIHGVHEGVLVYRMPGTPVTPCGRALGVVEVDVDPGAQTMLLGDGRAIIPGTKTAASSVAVLKAMMSQHPSVGRATDD